MKTNILAIPALVAVLTLGAGASFAKECGEGHMAAAKRLGVDPTMFTLSELAMLDAAIDDDNCDLADLIKTRNEHPEVSRGVSATCELPAS